MILTSAVYMTWPPTPQGPSATDPLSPPERGGSDAAMTLGALDAGHQATVQSLDLQAHGAE